VGNPRRLLWSRPWPTLATRRGSPETNPRSCGSQTAHESLFNRRLGAPSPASRFAICHPLRRTLETRQPAQGLDREHESRMLESRARRRDLVVRSTTSTWPMAAPRRDPAGSTRPSPSMPGSCGSPIFLAAAVRGRAKELVRPRPRLAHRAFCPRPWRPTSHSHPSLGAVETVAPPSFTCLSDMTRSWELGQDSFYPTSLLSPHRFD
jgi:hypothetical protein